LQKHLDTGIVPAIACYKRLGDIYGKEKAFTIVKDALLRYADEDGLAFVFLSKIPCFFKLLRAFLPPFLKRVFPPVGWDFRWKPITRNEIAFNAHSCFYLDVFKKYDAFELTSIFCETDDICYRKFKYAEWKRVKTLGRGDAVCDFRFVKPS
jgi:hypothetical protein